MIRRRRPRAEILFSFDSFLDIVANVVGVIIRLILVVWVGARSYTSLQPLLKSSVKPLAVQQKGELPPSPLVDLLAERRRELEEVQKRLLEQLRRLQDLEADQAKTGGPDTTIEERRRTLEREGLAIVQAAKELDQADRQRALSATEIQERCRKLREEIRQVEQQPAPKKVLRYRTPVSQPVHSEELHFECRGGRVAFIDVAALLGDVRRSFEETGKLLQTQWQIEDVTPPVGAFRLRYVVQRERDFFDTLGGQAAPEANGSFRYSLSEWQVEPIMLSRGEAMEAAMAEGSEFRQIVDGIEPGQTAVTFWVYPDSFEIFRRLRDFLYQRDIMVAGRPLPDGIPIASSRRGSLSRGQ